MESVIKKPIMNALQRLYSPTNSQTLNKWQPVRLSVLHCPSVDGVGTLAPLFRCCRRDNAAILTQRTQNSGKPKALLQLQRQLKSVAIILNGQNQQQQQQQQQHQQQQQQQHQQPQQRINCHNDSSLFTPSPESWHRHFGLGLATCNLQLATCCLLMEIIMCGAVAVSVAVRLFSARRCSYSGYSPVAAKVAIIRFSYFPFCSPNCIVFVAITDLQPVELIRSCPSA
uniref:HDC07436 n=1 Tax=Drosophila melanogaster TaxID=7227 RepID=Q6IM63_DROME|nr:TPA_inf: HDC07436 [Drosophila melanogaster]